MDQRRHSQSVTLLRFWARGRKLKTFVYQFLQHAFLVAVIFTTATIFTNYDIVFGRISEVLNAGDSVDLSRMTLPSSGVPTLSSFDWGTLSSPFGHLVLNSGNAEIIAEMNKVMLIAGILTIGLLILRESLNSFHQSRLTFIQLEVAIRGVLYHGASRRSVRIFNAVVSGIQAVSAYCAGVLLSVYVILPLVASRLHDTFFNFLVSSVPFTSYVVVAIPVVVTMLVSVSYFAVRVRNVKLN